MKDTKHRENTLVFEDLFKKNYVSILRYCQGYVHNEVVAKDLVQDSFKVLWEKRDVFFSNPNINYVLFTIVRNKSINYLKHKSIELKYASDYRKEYIQTELNIKALEYDGSDLLIAKEVNNCIESAIDELPEKCRQVLELSKKKGLKNREIAEKLSISIKTVEAQMTKALKLLRNRLDVHFK
ncbi:MAG: RNA polymerase sigma-70 factor [Labilibaculum sp.]|nr:RNA polymerase sigma-70 factor [Labilibaculum sp.]MBI9059052.1 RNA polymerase sigma-70 factor [Labilibaculum sp.]